MNTSIVLAFIIVFIITIMIFVIKNHEQMEENMQLSNKLFNIVFFITILIIMGLIIYLLVAENVESIKLYIIETQNLKKYEEMNKKIEEENAYWKQQIQKEYNIENSYNPYIPTGFSYVEGTVDTGYVIEDENKNQYVWVPCLNREYENIVKLQKSDFGKRSYIYKEGCYDIKYKEFIRSALENGGFYVSRYEIGKEGENPVSKAQSKIWTNISRKEAKKIINKMYGNNEEINCEIINGYAYDTALLWIENTNNIQKYVKDYSKQKIEYAGRNSYSNIYDFTDNMLELTNENYYDVIVTRGFTNDETIDEATGNKYSDSSRNTTLDEDSTVTYIKDALALRIIIYKK